MVTLSGARCRSFAYGPADATVSPQTPSLSSFKSRLVLPLWYRLNQVVLEKRPLNGYSSSISTDRRDAVHPVLYSLLVVTIGTMYSFVICRTISLHITVNAST